MKTARFFTLIILSLCLLGPQMLLAQGRRDNTARDSLRREMRRAARLRSREVEPVRIDSALLEGDMRMVGKDGRIALSLEGGVPGTCTEAGCPEGTTMVDNIHFIERGYENLIEKMTSLGADIKRIED